MGISLLCLQGFSAWNGHSIQVAATVQGQCVSNPLLCLQGPRALEGYSTQLATFAWRTGTDSFDDDIDDLGEEGSSSSGLLVLKPFVVLNMPVPSIGTHSSTLGTSDPLCVCAQPLKRRGKAQQLARDLQHCSVTEFACPRQQQDFRPPS